MQDLESRYQRMAFGPLDDFHVNTRDHLPFMRSVAKGEVLEIGVHAGNSTCALLLGIRDNGGHLTSVDIQDYSSQFDDANWTFIQSDSRKYVPTRKFDVIFIDGEHSYDFVKSDVNMALHSIKEGGLILMHDVECPTFPGVRQAFDEIELPKYIRSGSWGMGVATA